MPGVPWTKFQDFYLRLGFIKVLVAALSPFRRSVSNETIYRRLESPLFKSVLTCASLAEATKDLTNSYTTEEQTEGRPYVLEAQLVADNCPSWLFAVTSKTIYKILDWGHDIQIVGQGNQITERGLLLRSLLPPEAEQFLGGDCQAWNPFLLTPIERLFFLYHIGEIDRVTFLLIDLLAERSGLTVLESSDAGRLTCRALFTVLNDARHDLSPRFVPQFRVAYDLAVVIARELGMKEYLPEGGDVTLRTRKPPRPLKIVRRTGSALQSSGHRKKPNKNADHQTIPRFEQLVDLGFLEKKQGVGEEATTPPQKRWRYRPAELCKLWTAAKTASETPSVNWFWSSFARTAAQSFRFAATTATKAPPSEVVNFFADAYEATHRPIGHTPLESVALYAMLHAAAQGLIIEVADFHRMMLEIKRNSLLPDHAFFASGNDVDTMFINLRRGYREKLLEIAPKLLQGVQNDPSQRSGSS